MANFSNAQIGDNVKDPALFGDVVGVIKHVHCALNLLSVRFSGGLRSYTLDGQLFTDAIPTLRYLCPDGTLSETRPEKKWAKVVERVRNREDVKVYVWNNDYGEHYNRYFVGCRLGNFEVYADGKTGFTTGQTELWPFCELAEPEKFADCMEEEKVCL